MKVVHEPMKKGPEQHTSHCDKEKAREERVTRCEDLCAVDESSVTGPIPPKIIDALRRESIHPRRAMK